MSARSDPALEVLLLPFVQGALAWPQRGGALFLRAREGWPLHQRAWPGLVAEQSYKPEADALQRSGIEVNASHDGGARHALVLALPPRQREEARALLAHALARCAPGGRVVACVANDEGAKSAQADLARIAGPVASLSKHHCRVFWTAPLDAPADPDLARQWRDADAPRPVVAGPGGLRFLSRPGVFAWDRIDAASALLAERLPQDLAGRAADLGAGWGYLGHALLTRCPGIVALDLYEAERRALELAERNLAGFAARVELGFRWHDVAAGLPERYDVVVSNPPFHAQGRAARPGLGRRFIAVAAQALRPGGRLWLVANRHLPYEAELAAGFASVRAVAERDGFKVIEAVKEGGR